MLSNERCAVPAAGAILALAIFAAVITPSSDPYSMLALMIPLYLFYEAAIIVSRLLKR